MRILTLVLLTLLTASVSFAQERLGPIDERNTTARLRALIEADHKEMAAATPLRVAAAEQAAPMAIHGHPQKTTYANQSEWPLLISAQTHFLQPNGILAHTHVELVPPIWAETTRASFTMTGQIQLFHTQGYIGAFESHFRSRVRWHAPGGALLEQLIYRPPFEIVGNPHGLVVVPFDLTIDPTRSDNTLSLETNTSLHGWWNVAVTATTNYTADAGHDIYRPSTGLFIPFFSMIDPSQPIEENRSFPRFWAQSNLGETQAYASWGSQYCGGLPPILAPISAPVNVLMAAWEYPGTLPATTRVVGDLALHDSVPGRDLAMGPSVPGCAGNLFTFDPALLGSGPHKIAVWWQRNAPGLELGTLLVVTVNVGPGAPPPPPVEVCGDGIDNDLDGQIDEGCAPPPPPPPPPPTWTPFTPTFGQQGDSIRICRPDTKCTDPIPVH